MSDRDHDRFDGAEESNENDQTAEAPDSPAEPMSDDSSSTATDEQSTTTSPDRPADQSTGRNIERYVRYAMLAVFTLLALIALLRFYFAASNAIDVWVSDEYRSLFQAVFNLVVLLIAGIGISWQVRELK